MDDFCMPVEYVDLQFRVRRNALATLRMPIDLTKEETEKLANQIRASWIESTVAEKENIEVVNPQLSAVSNSEASAL